MKRKCDACGTTYEAKRRTSKYCSSLCRTRVSRAAGKPEIIGLPSAKTSDKPGNDHGQPSGRTGFVGSVETRLADADRLDTVLGQQALLLAEKMLDRMNTGSSVASLSKEFRSVMDAAMEGVGAAEDPVELLRRNWVERLERRRSG